MISRIFFLIFLTSILFTSGIFLTINAQLPGSNSGGSSQNDLTSTTNPKKSVGVRITSPITGDAVFINGTNYFNKNGEKLSMLGTSVTNTNSSSTCFVSIIANGVKPYQLTNGTGPKGNSDYSTWKYTFSPSYVALTEGSNKITSKLTCEPGNLVAYYSVNVTGSKFNGTFPSAIVKPLVVQSKSFNNAAPLNLTSSTVAPSPLPQSNLSLNTAAPTPTAPTPTAPTPTAPTPTAPTPTAPTPTAPTPTAPLNSTSSTVAPSPLPQSTGTALTLNSMSVTIDKKEIGKIQTIVMSVADSITGKPVGGAFLTGNINNEPFSGITNSGGDFSKGIPSSLIKSSSTIDVTVTATAEGYKTNKASAAFDISSSSSTSTSTSTTGTNTNGKSGAKDMASKIAKDVQNQLSKQGINIPLPFG